MKTIEEYLEGKSVALLCGGPIDENFIVECDCRASINMAAIRHEEIDIAYCTGGMVGENFVIAKRKDYKYFRYFFGKPNEQINAIINAMTEWFEDCGTQVSAYVEGDKNNLHATPWAQEMRDFMQTMPLSGLMVLRDLLNFPVREVRVTGMTFFAVDGVVPFARDVHRMQPQRDYLQKLFERDERIVLDPACVEALMMPIEGMKWAKEGNTISISILQPDKEKYEQLKES